MWCGDKSKVCFQCWESQTDVADHFDKHLLCYKNSFVLLDAGHRLAVFPLPKFPKKIVAQNW